MRNESNTEFLFWQSNPNINDDDEEIRGTGWKPVKYRLPPRSVMPYAWDSRLQGEKRSSSRSSVQNGHQTIRDRNAAADADPANSRIKRRYY